MRGRIVNACGCVMIDLNARRHIRVGESCH